MRVVLDTTILVRANHHANGIARELLLAIISGRHSVLLSNEMLYELARVLRYPRLQAIYGLSDEQLYEFISFLYEVAEIIKPNPLLAVPMRDMNDIVVLQTALIGGADVICTTDADFYDRATTTFLSEAGITVMNDVALIRRLRS